MNLDKSSGGRLLYLDSARGLAAFSVMITHFIASFQLTDAALSKGANPLHFFYYGEADILFFFVHSGFILSYSITNRINKTKTSAYGRFLIERIFRIYPLFLFIVLLSYVLKETLFPLGDLMNTTTHLQGYWKRSIDVKALLNELALIHSVSQEGTKRLLPQEWTAAVEIVIGCLIPLLLFLIKKVKKSWIYWPIILFSVKILGFSSFLFDFALGVYLFYYADQIKNIWRSLAIQIKWIFLSLAILFFSCFFWFSSLFNFDRVFIRPGVDHVIVSLGCSLFFCILISAPKAQKMLSHPLLITMGRICYSLYLVHMMILICFADYAVQQIQKLSGLPVSACILLFFIFYAGLTFVISLLTFKILEKPFNKLGKQIAKKTEKMILLAENHFFKRRIIRMNIDK